MRKNIRLLLLKTIFIVFVVFLYQDAEAYDLGGVRGITYKNVGAVLTEKDLDLTPGNYVFTGLTDSLPYTVTEDDKGINKLTIYSQKRKRTVKVVITDAFREVDRDGWTIIEPNEDTRVIYVSSSGGTDEQSHPDSMSNLPPAAHYACDIGINSPYDKPADKYSSYRRINPVMSGYTEPEGEASASSWGRDLNAWKAFSGSTGHSGWFAGYRNNGWLQYRFKSPRLISGYVVYNRGSDDPDAAPRDWVFKGSNDEENWDVLDEVSDETGWSRAERREFKIKDPDYYEYYRIDVSDDNGANRLHIGELELMGMKEIDVVPVKSLSKAMSLVRSNHNSRDGNDYPDWILLKRGDVWDGAMGWKMSGPSPDEPIVIAAYGDPSLDRPSIHRFRVQDSGPGEARADNWIISGLDLRQGGHLRNVNPDNILIEDCLLSGSGQFNFQSNGDNQDFRRNVIVDNYSTSSHAQGIYAGGARNLLIEENIFDHNGWNPDVDGAEPTIFNHNIYLSNSSRDARVYRNIVSRGSSYGLQAGGGGWIRENIFTRNVYHIMAGARIRTRPPGVRAVIEGNVVTEGVSAGSGRNPGNGKGIEVANLNPEFEHVVSENIVFNTADYEATNSGHGALTTVSFHEQDEVGQKDLVIENNIIYNWPRSLRLNRYDENMTVSGNIVQQSSDKFSLNYLVSLGADMNEYDFCGNTWYAFDDSHEWFENGSNMVHSEWVENSGETNSKWKKVDFLSPERTLASYNASLGGEESFEKFIYAAREQSRHNWDWDYHPVKILEYFRKGFTVLYDPESLKISGPDTLNIPVSGEKSAVYQIDIKDKYNTPLSDEPYTFGLADEDDLPGVFFSQNRLILTPEAEPGKYVLEAKVNDADEISDEFTLVLYYGEDPPDTIMQGRSFITPSNPKLKFGKEAREVVITDTRGNEVFRKERGSSRFIIWNPGKRGLVSIESGLYIYRIRTDEGYKYGSVVVAK